MHQMTSYEMKRWYELVLLWGYIIECNKIIVIIDKDLSDFSEISDDYEQNNPS